MEIRRQTEQQLVLVQDPRLLALILKAAIGGVVAIFLVLVLTGNLAIAVLFLLIGVSVLGGCYFFLVQSVELVLDRARGEVRLTRKSLYEQTSDVFAFDRLFGAVIQYQQSSGGMTQYRPELALRPPGGTDETLHPITTMWVSGTNVPDRLETLVTTINRWLYGDDADHHGPGAFIWQKSGSRTRSSRA